MDAINPETIFIAITIVGLIIATTVMLYWTGVAVWYSLKFVKWLYSQAHALTRSCTAELMRESSQFFRYITSWWSVISGKFMFVRLQAKHRPGYYPLIAPRHSRKNLKTM